MYTAEYNGYCTGGDKEYLKEFFAQMALKYADNNNVIYEICNEPNGGTSWEDIKNYAGQVIPVIRQYDKDSVIIVGTPNWSQYVNQAAESPISGYENIMYSFHFYAGTHKEDMRQNVQNAIDVEQSKVNGFTGDDLSDTGKWFADMMKITAD